MKTAIFFLIAISAFAQNKQSAEHHLRASEISTDNLLSQPGPTFTIADADLPNPVTVITFGDQRFTDPSNVRSTNPRIREFLVHRIADEKPGAILLNGDVPLSGAVPNDYKVFATETKCWRDAQLNVFPALGNHEFGHDPYQALENWWTAFPKLRNRRWYSVALGSRVYIIALDSDTSLLPGSTQATWLDQQLNTLPSSVDMVVLSIHHPPVADVQKHIEVSHNPRPNEIALRDYLSQEAKSLHARIVVTAGHIHNYERHMVDNVAYFVSGGGGAHPYFVERTPDDLYQSILFPNYHYLKFTLGEDAIHGEMYRVVDPEAATLSLAAKDSFDIPLKKR